MGERVTFSADGRTASGYLALPAGSGPAVIVIHEWWGLKAHMESVAERFAAEGFVALAPDMYNGRTASTPEEAEALMMGMKLDEVAENLSGAVRYLQQHPKTVGTKVGSVGFCLGGALALYGASHDADVGACVTFYGAVPHIKPDLAALQAPVLGLWAEHDHYITADIVADLDRQLTKHGKRHEFHTYPVQHAFFNDTRPTMYDAAAAADAWTKTLSFLRRELKAT